MRRFTLEAAPHPADDQTEAQQSYWRKSRNGKNMQQILRKVALAQKHFAFFRTSVVAVGCLKACGKDWKSVTARKYCVCVVNQHPRSNADKACRDLTRGGYKEQVRGYCREGRRSTGA